MIPVSSADIARIARITDKFLEPYYTAAKDHALKLLDMFERKTRMQVFEYLVYKDEKVDKDGEVTDKAIVLSGPMTTFARDLAQAQLIAARTISDADMDDIDRIKVVVRPF